MPGFSDYDLWKLATPPEYDWPEDRCEDCGERFTNVLNRWGCYCDDEPEFPHPDELADFIDEAHAALRKSVHPV